MTPLAELPVLFLDAQATGAFPRGALLELGWLPWASSAGEAVAEVVARPPGAALPAAVTRVTGLRLADWSRGAAPEAVWRRLRAAAAALGPGAAPTLVHFARFEEPYLRELHRRHGDGPFPLRLVCTHAIARRLLPELPRRTLRALAGYFGAAVPPLRRSRDHVAATATVWRHLAALLAEREGLGTLDQLLAWLATPARRAPRQWPLARARRLALPQGPGVYRFHRAGGAVLYVGKATCLRQRVSGHLHADGERALEMLTQARDVTCAETATALEAALLEADEIKRLAPPYNVALGAGRPVWFATTGLDDPREQADATHPVGPLGSRAPLDALLALRAALADGRPASLARRSRALGVPPAWAPAPDCFAGGLALFAARHGRPASPRLWLRLGARLWLERRAAAAARGHDADQPDEAARRWSWDPEHVSQRLEQTVLRAAHAVRRARWLVRLSECALAWQDPGAGRERLLVLEGGAVTAGGERSPGSPLPLPPGHDRPPAQRREALDLAAFDRLRVLTTELRALADGAGTLELRLGRHARLSRRRLQAVLREV